MRCASAADVEVDVREGVSFFGDRSDDVDAVATAALEADVVVVCVGEPSSLSGEAASRSDLRLPGRQADLIRAIAGTGIPFVVVLANGRPLVVADWIDHAPAVLEVWHGGTEAPAAIVDLLFGDQEPAGRLPMSFPRSEGQVPVYYARENTGRPATVRGSMTLESVDVVLEGPANVKDKYTSKYLDLDLGPQFAFGHGSGYATFTHGAARVSASEIGAGETVVLSLDVTNTSARAGDEVVQVYVEDLVASVAPPVRRLVAFERRTLAPGETATFAFSIGPRAARLPARRRHASSSSPAPSCCTSAVRSIARSPSPCACADPLPQTVRRHRQVETVGLPTVSTCRWRFSVRRVRRARGGCGPRRHDRSAGSSVARRR